MKLKTILLAIVFGLFATTLHASSKSGKQVTETTKRQEINQSTYIIGGLVGTFTFLPGAGHAIQGRWSSGGWIHTALQAGLFVVLVGAFSIDGQWWSKSEGVRGNYLFPKGTAISLIRLGSLAFVSLKIYEIISVWHVDTKKYQLVDKKPPSVIVSPVLSNAGAGMMIAMSLP